MPETAPPVTCATGPSNFTVTESGGTETGHGTGTPYPTGLTLTEGDLFLVSASQAIVIPATDASETLAPPTTVFQFAYTNLRFDATDTDTIKDAFEVALFGGCRRPDRANVRPPTAIRF